MRRFHYTIVSTGARRALSLLCLPLLLLVAACTDTEQFRVNGTIDGNATMNLRVTYYADGAYRQLITAAREGKFEFFGRSSHPTLVDIYDYDNHLLARLYAANGETFEVAVDRSRKLGAEISGNEVSERLARVYRDSADVFTADAVRANAAVASYVAAHPSDVVSTLLMLTVFDASAAPLYADSLMASIDHDARPTAIVEGYNFLLQRLVSEEATGAVTPFRYAMRGDSTAFFRPEDRPLSLLVFDRSGDYRSDSVAPALNRLARRHAKSLTILELDQEPYGSLVSVQPDTLRWTIARVPGGVAGQGIGRLGIPSEPYFIVCDSIGSQLYRGPHISVAERIINSH
ncbi:MAG: hypothetical protein K2M55_09570 [Muribaculaceae bacterium]|nr:hypothetical protein [Muribaculaceae bacterium]